MQLALPGEVCIIISAVRRSPYFLLQPTASHGTSNGEQHPCAAAIHGGSTHRTAGNAPRRNATLRHAPQAPHRIAARRDANSSQAPRRAAAQRLAPQTHRRQRIKYRILQPFSGVSQ